MTIPSSRSWFLKWKALGASSPLADFGRLRKTSDVFGLLRKTSDFFQNLRKWSCRLQKSQHSQDKNLMLISQKKLAGIFFRVLKTIIMPNFMLLTESEQLKHISTPPQENRRAFCMRMHQYVNMGCWSATEAFSVTIVYVQYQHLQAVFWSWMTCIGCYVPQTCSLRYQGISTMKVSLL